VPRPAPAEPLPPRPVRGRPQKTARPRTTGTPHRSSCRRTQPGPCTQIRLGTCTHTPLTTVVGGQANITCELLNLYLDDGTAIAEWEATFDDTAQQVRKRMREVALLTFDGLLIDSLREYWASEELPTAALAHQQRNPNGG
jgi:hypothetical protein